MSDRCFVDTNILVYAHDRAGGVRHNRARAIVKELWRSGNGALSTQVLQELCVNLRRKVATPLTTEECRQIVSDYSNWHLVTNSSDSILHALDIEARFKISFWDALILQAANEAGASILYSEDLASGQRYGAIRVIDPFAGP